MKGAIWPSMTTLSDLWKTFRFLTDLETIPEDKKAFLHDFLKEEYRKKELRRIEYLLKMSGIKRTKILSDFDWKFIHSDINNCAC